MLRKKLKEKVWRVTTLKTPLGQVFLSLETVLWDFDRNSQQWSFTSEPGTAKWEAWIINPFVTPKSDQF